MAAEQDVQGGGFARSVTLVYSLGYLACFFSILSLRCFLRSRMSAGAGLLFCAVVFAYLTVSPRISSLTTGRINLFRRIIISIVLVALPGILLIFQGVFHPLWIFAGSVFLVAGAIRLSREDGDSCSICFRETFLVFQMILLPLFLLLYFTGVAASSGFIWLYPLYCIFICFANGLLSVLLLSRYVYLLICTISTAGVMMGLVSEFFL